jgi:hypothetical protein
MARRAVVHPGAGTDHFRMALRASQPRSGNWRSSGFITRMDTTKWSSTWAASIIKDHGRTDGARFVVGRRSYGTVILPPGAESLNRPTVRLLDQLRKRAASSSPLAQRN